MKRINFEKVNVYKLWQWSAWNSNDSKYTYKALFKVFKHWTWEYIMQHLGAISNYKIYNCIVYIIIWFSSIFTFVYSSDYIINSYIYDEKILTSVKNQDLLIHEIEQFSKIQDDLKILHKDIDKIDKIIPETQKEEEVLFILWNLLSMNKIPSPDKYHWTKLNSNALIDPNLSEGFEVYSYSLNSIWSLEDISNLINDLKTNLRLIDVKQIKMSPLAWWNIKFSVSVWAYNKKT